MSWTAPGNWDVMRSLCALLTSCLSVDYYFSWKKTPDFSSRV